MRTRIGLMVIIGLVTGCLTGCAAGAIATPGEGGVNSPTSENATKPPIAAVPSEAGEVTPPAGLPSESTPGSVEMSKTPIPASIGRAPDELVRMVTEDLAKRLNIPTENITVVAAIGQEFTAEAFRCQGIKERITRDVTPELISGFSIVLSAAGQRYEYHASEDSVIFCRRML